MQFTTFLAFAVSLVAAMPQATPTTSSAAATSTADLEAICEAQAYGYKQYCPQCLHNCATSSVPDQCFYSVFTVVNAYESDCEAHGGSNCASQAINQYC
ncbi:hypothetical protein F5Y07DRAFT_205844 [Xylaria sp. FL0933]|nr:hypothetical protein F5Y07DRAFT_205844 [Xylaria sp. FL0933]